MSEWDKYKTVKPCPFCGDFYIRIRKRKKVGWHIFCDICEIEGPIGMTENSAVTKWNERPDTTKVITTNTNLLKKRQAG